ncbi:MAG: DUF2147 domain-containing protein [Bacteroidales bacterium]|nr:DUF2147 domain-containing protein [Bacteroidales bacterium]
MKKIFTCIILTLAATFAMSAQVDKLLGEWKTVDDKSGKQVSIVNVYKADNGLYYGKLIKLLQKDSDQSIIGTMIIKDMKAEDGALTGGRVYDPDNGKTYYAKVTYDPKNNTLVLRGSLDKRGLIGRSQTWVR